MQKHRLFALMFVLLMSSFTTGAPASMADGDWPQWRGANRNGLSSETGLMKEWPAGGPKTVWSVSEIGEGFGAVSVSGDRIYVQGTRGDASMVFGLNRADGKTVWSTALGPKGNERRGNGPRSTPTVDADRLYVLTENGDLACLRARDGSSVWRKNIACSH